MYSLVWRSRRLLVVIAAAVVVACDGQSVVVTSVPDEVKEVIQTGDRIDETGEETTSAPEPLAPAPEPPAPAPEPPAPEPEPPAPAPEPPAPEPEPPAPEPEPPAPAPDNPPVASGPGSITDLVLITGQSNALGSRTAFDTLLDSPVDRFYAYTDTGWEKASLKQVWDLDWHPRTSPDTDPHNNFGFHFGKQLAQLDSHRVIGIVLITAPGEGISHWAADGAFFNQIRQKALSAINALPHKNGFDGILWHQGETDWTDVGTSDPDSKAQANEDNYYSDSLYRLISNFRSESWFSGGKPFICGETAQSPVNSHLTNLNRDDDVWTGCVAAEGFATYDSAGVHFTAESLRELGRGYAELYFQMTGR